MEPVTLILLFEGLGHGMLVIGWHMADRKKMSKASNRPEFILPTSRSSLIQVLVVLGNFSQGNPNPMCREPAGAHDFTSCRQYDSMDLMELPKVFCRNPSPVNGTEEGSSLEFGRGRSRMARQARVSRIPSRSWTAWSEFEDRVAQGRMARDNA